MIIPAILAVAQTMTFSADRIAADNATRALTATGHIVAAVAPLTLRGDCLTRAADGTMTFHDPTCVTTCTNAVGHTHWSVTGEVEYREKDYVLLRNMWLRFFEVPVFWLPYLYYPLDTDCGFSWMPGYTGHFGAYLFTKYTYHLLGDPSHGRESAWLKGATRFDLRYRQGLALGEDLDWNLGSFGRGGFVFYYAWDQDADEYRRGRSGAYTDTYHSYNWGSPVKTDRYHVGLHHTWEATERDTVRLAASVVSDSSFFSDFDHNSLFNWQEQWRGYSNNGVFWEHVENQFALGAEASGRLNEFYAMTDRLPEIYVDVNPQPLFGLPVNYESENRVGYLRRNPAEYGYSDRDNPFSFNPGAWAYYDAFRLDTYHRLTAPFRTFDDIVSVVPRVAFRGTGWTESGRDNLTGWGSVQSAGELFRSILEGGATFAGRGTGWINDRWRHLIEPYVDVLAQKAWMAGGGRRPYVFDGLDASFAWDDQFAGRARNLPYTYYGVTPGTRTAWDALDDKGRLRTVVDVDVYTALQFNKTSYTDGDDNHRLAEPGEPNYGKRDCLAAPGARVRWHPEKDLSLMARAEYDSDNNRIAFADAGLRHRLSRDFTYNVDYILRDFRCWDFSSSPYDPSQMTGDEFNYAHYQYVNVGFEHNLIDWLAWSPYIRWDIRRNELERVGTWFDILTDCLGFRFAVEYQNSYTRLDGHERNDDWSFGFFIYLRAYGPGSNGIFSF